MATFTGTGASESIQPGLVSPTVVSSGGAAPGAGVDVLDAQDGADTLDGGADGDALFGGAGDDRLIWNVGGGTDMFEGGGDIDTAQVNGDTTGEIFTIAANGARVRFDGISPVAFSIDIGTTENLVVNMGAGNDSITAIGNLAALIALTIDGGAGNDTILGSNGADTLLGGDNDDFIDGNQGNDFAFLGSGNDVFQWDPGDGSDVVEGGSGYDTLRFNGSNGPEIFDLSANGSRTVLTRNVGNIVMDFADIEEVEINALGGADGIEVNAPIGVTFIGQVATIGTRVIINLGASLGSTTGDGQADTVTINAGTGNNRVVIGTGSVGNVAISGLEAANDSVGINGMSGDDTIVAGHFQFALVIDGGTESDTVSYLDAGAGVTVSLIDPSRNEGASSGHTYIAVENIEGSGFDDYLIGNDDANDLRGGYGADYLQGLGGNDIYRVDDAGDIVIETASGGLGDRVVAHVSYVLAGPARVEIMELAAVTGGRAMDLTGNDHAQSLTGNKGRNQLIGRGGDDFFYGGKAADTLDGGAGKDTFVFNTKLGLNHIDKIKGFVKVDDTIILDNDVFTALTTLGKLSQSAFHKSTNGQAHDVDDRIIYDTATGKLFYDKDGIFGGAAVQIATLSGHPAIGAGDFVIV